MLTLATQMQGTRVLPAILPPELSMSEIPSPMSETVSERSALAVFEESPGATAKECGEGFERRDVDALQIALGDEAVGDGERQARPLGELVRVLDSATRHPRLQVPSDRHGLTVAYNSPLDKTNATVRFPGSQRSVVVKNIPSVLPGLVRTDSGHRRIFCRGGRTGKKIHRSSTGSSVLDCGIWLKANCAHFEIRPQDMQRAQAKNLCEKCFSAYEIEVADSDTPDRFNTPLEPANA